MTFPLVVYKFIYLLTVLLWWILIEFELLSPYFCLSVQALLSLSLSLSTSDYLTSISGSVVEYNFSSLLIGIKGIEIGKVQPGIPLKSFLWSRSKQRVCSLAL